MHRQFHWPQYKGVYACFAVSVPKIWWLWGKWFSPVSESGLMFLKEGISATGFELELQTTAKVQNQNDKMSFVLLFLPQFLQDLWPTDLHWEVTWLKSHKGDFVVTFTKSPPPVKQHQQISRLFCLLVEKVQILPLPGVLWYYPETH